MVSLLLKKYSKLLSLSCLFSHESLHTCVHTFLRTTLHQKKYSAFCHSPVYFHAHFSSCAHVFPRTPADICTHSSTYACSSLRTIALARPLQHMLMPAYRRENDKSRVHWPANTYKQPLTSMTRGCARIALSLDNDICTLYMYNQSSSTHIPLMSPVLSHSCRFQQ